jgi:diadenosine tetraphosphate (Ap4A) HIT family hydrolase
MKIFPREAYLPPKNKWEWNCPFCDLNEELIIWRWKYFCIRHNKFPYLWIKEHLLVTPIRHVSETKNLTKEEFWEFVEIEEFMQEFYWNNRYFSFIRQFWAMKSINHLHYHYLPWEILLEEIESCLIKSWFERNTNFD